MPVVTDRQHAIIQYSADPKGALFRALRLAVRAHGGQARKLSGVPYVFHPINVAKILIDYGCEEYIVVSGLLHDTVEDTAVTVEAIREHFGNEVTRIVASVSEPDKSKPWEERKRHTVENIKTHPMDVLLVECADKLDNIRSIRMAFGKYGGAIWSAFNRPEKQQRWYYQSLKDAFMERVQGEPSIGLFTEFVQEVELVFR